MAIKKSGKLTLTKLVKTKEEEELEKLGNRGVISAYIDREEKKAGNQNKQTQSRTTNKQQETKGQTNAPSTSFNTIKRSRADELLGAVANKKKTDALTLQGRVQDRVSGNSASAIHRTLGSAQSGIQAKGTSVKTTATASGTKQTANLDVVDRLLGKNTVRSSQGAQIRGTGETVGADAVKRSGTQTGVSAADKIRNAAASIASRGITNGADRLQAEGIRNYVQEQNHDRQYGAQDRLNNAAASVANGTNVRSENTVKAEALRNQPLTIKGQKTAGVGDAISRMNVGALRGAQAKQPAAQTEYRVPTVDRETVAQRTIDTLNELGQKSYQRQAEKQNEEYRKYMESVNPKDLTNKADRDYLREYLNAEKQKNEDDKAAYQKEHEYDIVLTGALNEYYNIAKEIRTVSRNGMPSKQQAYDWANRIGNIAGKEKGELEKRVGVEMEKLVRSGNFIGAIQLMDKTAYENRQEMVPETYESRKYYLDEKLKDLDEADRAWSEIDKLEALAKGIPFDDLKSYDDVVNRDYVGIDDDWHDYDLWGDRPADKSLTNVTDPLERSYVIAKNRYYYQTQSNGGTKAYKEEYMTDEQADTFTRFMEAGKRDEAKAYLDALTPYLNKRKTETEMQKWREFMEASPVNEGLARAASWGFRLAGGVTGTIGALGSLLGVKEAQDPNSYFYYPTNLATTIQGTHADLQGKRIADITGSDIGYTIGSGAAKLVDDVVNNWLAMGLGGAGGGAANVAKNVVLTLMSAGATSSSFVKYRNRGLDPTTSSLMALGDFAIEWFTEEFGIDTLLNPNVGEMIGSGSMKRAFLAKNIIAEGSEEVLSNALSLAKEEVVSALTDYQSEIESKANQYLMQKLAERGGMVSEEQKEQWRKEGFTEAWKDFAAETVESFVLGGAAGYLSAKARTLANDFAQQNTGRSVRSGGNGQSFIDRFRNPESGAGARVSDSENGNIRMLQKIMESMKEGTQSRDMANEFGKKMDAGKRISNQDLGRAVQTVLYETSEQIGTEAKKAAAGVVEQRLVEMQVDPQEAKQLADIVIKAKTAGIKALNREERNALDNSYPAFDIYQAMAEPHKLADNEAGKKARETAEIADVAGIASTINEQAKLATVSALAEGKSAWNLVGWDHTNIQDKDVHMASAEKIAAAGQDRNFAKQTLSAMVSGDAAKIIGFKDGKIEVETAQGTMPAELADVQSVNPNMAQLVAYMRVHPGAMSDTVANAALNILDTLGDKAGGQIVSDVANINFAARTWQSMPKDISIGKDAAKVIWDTARADAEAAEVKRIKATPKLDPGHGKTTFDGAEHGTAAWGEKIQGVEKSRRREMDAAATIAKYLGIRVNFINDDSEAGQQMHGSYVDGAITLNLAAKEKNVLTGEDGTSPITSMSHELLHFLEQNNRDEYAQIRGIALNELKLQGVDIESKALQLMDRYNAYYKQNNQNTRMTLDDAIYEIVADSCDQLLTSKEFTKRLQEQDPAMYGNIRSFVQKWTRNIREALTNIRGQASYFAQNVRLKKVDEIAKLWLGGYDKVIHDYVTGEAGQKITDKNGEYYSLDKDGNATYPEGWKSAEEVAPENDIRMKLADERTRKYLSMWANKHVFDAENEMDRILHKYGISVDEYRDGTMREGSAISKADQKKLQGLMNEAEKWQQKRVEAMGLDESDLGAQYIRAWQTFDYKRMEEILMEKMYGTEGVIPYKAPNWYDSQRHRQVANLIKEKNPEAITIAAVEMANLVPKNAVLVPMPPRTGVVAEDTDTMLLAKRIAQLTGRPVMNALEGNQRMSVKEAREAGAALTAEDLGFRQVMELPEGTIPYFIDNVVASGTTAKAAHDAFGGGITLAYAKGTRSGIEGLKKAQSTFWDPKQQYIIPLDERFDLSKKGQEGLKYKLSETGNDRYNRQTKANNTILKKIAKIRTNETLSVEEVENLIGKENITPAFNQWIHNTIDKRNNGIVTKQMIERFIGADNKRIREGSGNLIENWNKMSENGIKIYEKEIEMPKAPEGSRRLTDQEIGDKLFGTENGKRVQYKDYQNTDTDSTIRMSRKMIGETVSWNKAAGVPRYVVEQVLENAPELLENATYIGSHVNYANDTGNVHYLISNVKFGNTRDVVVFAVHDATRSNQEYEENAYVAEIMLINNKKANPSSPERSDNISAGQKSRDLRQVLPSENSIEEALQFVNADRIRFFDKNALKGKKVSLKLSDTNREYMAAVKSGDVEEQQRLVDMAAESALAESVMRLKNGKLRKLYHGTYSDTFTVFDPELIGTARDGDVGFFGKGFYFAYSKGEASYYGNNVMEVFLDMRNPFNYTKNFFEIDGQSSNLYMPRHATFVTKFAELFPELADKHTVTVWEKGSDSAKELSLKEFADIFKKTIEEKEFKVHKLETQDGTLWEATADPVKETYIGRDGKKHSFTDYKYTQRFYSEEDAKNQISNAYLYLSKVVYDNINMQSPTIITMETELSEALKKRGYDGVIQSEDGDEAVVFDSSQIKLADPVTYDDNGDVIPLDERFNRKQQDIRYKLGDDEQRTNIRNWMMTVTEDSLQTEAEKSLLRDYKALRMSIELDHMKIRNLKEKIAELEKVQDPNKHQKYMLDGYRIRLKNAESTQAEHEAKLEKITSSEGYAGLMYYQQQLMNSFTQGKTQDEVNEAVAGMEQTAKALESEISRTAEELKELAANERVRRIRAQVNSRTLDEAAARIRRKYNSTINKQELINELTKIRLMIQAGRDATADIEALAGMVLENRKSSERNASLEMLKGITLRLGESQIRELAGSDSGIRELRRMMAGSGVKVVKAKEGQGSLDANWDELISFVPALDGYEGIDTSNALNQAKAVAEFVMNAMQEQRESGAMEFADNMTAVFDDISGDIASIDVNLPADPAAREAIQTLNEYIMEMAGKATEATGKIEALQKQVDELIRTGRKAAMWSSNLKADIAQTIDYFDKTAKMAIDSAKKQKQDALIQQLKDEHTQKMLKANEEWRQLIERDKNARMQHEDNLATRKRIGTAINRVYNLLSAETDQKNIPENYKGIARELVKMLVNQDISEGSRRMTNASKKTLENARRLLDIWEKQDGPFDITDFIMNGTESDREIAETVMDDFDQIREGLAEWNGKYNGKNRLETLQQMGKTLEKVEEAVTEVYSIIQSARTMDLNGRKYQVEELGLRFLDGVKNSRFKGEMTTAAGKALEKVKRLAITGNTTPEYFFRELKNAGLDQIWDEFRRAENRNGLEIAKAKDKLAEIAEKHGYRSWDQQKTYKVQTLNGTVDMTLEQLMALWATWKREQTIGPEMSQHLAKGGFYVAEDSKGKGLLGRKKADAKAHPMDEDTMSAVGKMLTDEQKAYVDEMVEYLSKDMSELGNEASMRMYGIKKYKESYYFPFKRWSGVANFASDSGKTAANTENRAAHKGWTKRRMNMASNALEIGDFTKTAVAHAVEMINYNTMAPSIEAMNKMLNWQMQDYPLEGAVTKRSMRAVFEQEYGKDALNYLETLMRDMNGGVAQDPRGTALDALLSTFKKNAVAGSMSVTLQQPLSYIRAAMEINPVYMAEAMNPATWKGSYREMMAHSGVAVIKEMGRFDMGYGASAKEYVEPERQRTTGQKVRETISDYATKLPEMADRMTWTRIWTAVKYEQHAKHPDMNMKSDEFLDMVAERFNEVIRKTQVYDSILVKSSNMRSKSFALKSLTSFMAEPTLSFNVLRDAVKNIGEKGGKLRAAKAAATFLLSAVAQAAVKGMMGAGRKPDEKKTQLENFEYRMLYNLINEANPVSLIPGYSSLIDSLKNGELTNNATTVFGKLGDVVTTMSKEIRNPSGILYRLVEDTAGQIAQLFTGVPLKNIMRDVRAMANYFAPDSGLTALMGGTPFANRADSGAVRKYQALDTVMNQDLIGLVNKWMTDAGYGYDTSNKGYYKRILEARKAGDETAEDEMTEYLKEGKGVSDSAFKSGMSTAIRNDTDMSDADKIEMKMDDGTNQKSEITKKLKQGTITEAEAKELLKKADPEMTDDQIWWTIDRAEYARETGNENVSGNYYRLWDAMDANKSDEIKAAVGQMTAHGVEAKNIKTQITKQYKAAYMAADNNGKRTIRDAIHKAYKALGYTTEDADKTISKWK